jgi:hypothetical protein
MGLLDREMTTHKVRNFESALGRQATYVRVLTLTFRFVEGRGTPGHVTISDPSESVFTLSRWFIHFLSQYQEPDKANYFSLKITTSFHIRVQEKMPWFKIMVQLNLFWYFEGASRVVTTRGSGESEPAAERTEQPVHFSLAPHRLPRSPSMRTDVNSIEFGFLVF